MNSEQCEHGDAFVDEESSKNTQVPLLLLLLMRKAYCLFIF
jgi:hypothetical protein